MKKLALILAIGLLAFPAYAQVDEWNPSSMLVTPTGGTAGTLADKLQVDGTTIDRGANGIEVTGLVTPPTIDTGSGQVLTAQRGYHYITKNYCLASGAVGCWLMSSTATETDLTGTLNLTATGTVTTTTAAPTGYTGTARVFDQHQYLYANAEGTNLDISGANATISMGAWVYYTGTDSVTSSNKAIISKYNSTTNQRQYALTLFGETATAFSVHALLSASGTAADVTAVSTATNLSKNTWYHIAAVSNDTDVRIYVNGALGNTPAAYTSGLFDGTALFEIGAFTEDANNFRGYIKGAFVTNTALSSTDIAAIYNYGINGNKGGTTNLNTTTLPATAEGKTHCFRQETGLANPISITPPASSYVEAQDGSAYCTVSHAIQSAGASGDAICYQAKDATHWMASGGAVGAWTCQ